MPRWRRRQPHERETFGIALNQPTGPRPGPEILPWYWHPDREGALSPPEWFAKRLREIDPDLCVVFSPVHERYILWVKNPRIGHDPDPEVRDTIQMLGCVGWQLLMIWEHAETHVPIPLSELMFHNIYLISGERYPNARAYFDRIQEDIRRQIESRDKTFQGERQDFQNEYRKGTQVISSAGSGSKSALNDSVVPSRGEANWRADRRKWNLPAEMLQAERDQKEKDFYTP